MFLELSSLPVAWLIFIAFGFGIIIGSFLNVFIYRFHTGRSLNGHSHCMSCGVGLRPYDLLPVFSYLWLRGRCRACGCSFSARYMLVELGTGLLFVLALSFASSIFSLLLWWLLLSVLVVIFVYDIRHFIIPDSLTLITLLIVIVLTAPVLTDELLLMVYGFDVLAAGLCAVFLFLLWLVTKGRGIGFGDVKLVFPLALLVGYQGVFSMIVLSFWVGAGVSLLLLAVSKLQRGKLALPFMPAGLTIKSAVPFAPFLIVGTVVILFTNFNVLNLFTI